MDASMSVGSRFNGAGLRHLALLITVLLAGALVGVGCGGSDQPVQLTGMTRTPSLNVAGASLPQKNEKRADTGNQLKGPEDGLMLLFFGYTFCPDVCPTTMADLRSALAKLDPAERDRVEPAMATVDPKRDTPPVLNRYLGHFFPDGDFASFVPASQKQLGKVEQKFDLTHRYGKPDANGNYEVEHAAQVFAIDSGGQVLVEWPFGSQPENIASDIRVLLERIDDGTETESSQT